MEYLKINTEFCVGCGQCTMVCEFEAIETEWGEAKVKEELCVHCGACIEFCPIDALSLEER